MSLKWPSKDPNDTLDYSIDWSRFLNGGATIGSMTWYIDDANGLKQPFTPVNTVNGLTATGMSNSPTVTTIYLSDGTLNKNYKIYCRIVDTASRIVERSVTLSIKER